MEKCYIINFVYYYNNFHYKKISSDHNKRRLKVFVDIVKKGESLYN